MEGELSTKVNIAIITFPLGQASRAPLSNLTKLCGNLAKMVYVVSGNITLDISCRNFQIIMVDYEISTKLHTKIVNYLRTQLKIMRWVIWISRRVDLFIFTLEGEFLPVPVLILRLLRKKVILMPAGDEAKGYSIRKDPISRPVSVLVNLTSSLANRLILYSRRLVQEGTFARYQHKIIIAHRHFVDFNMFSMEKKIDNRLKIVGYIGRLSEEKGVLNLIKAIPLVLKERRDVQFIICGEGKLSDKIKRIVEAEGLKAHIKLMEWIPHEDVPRYLNELKLLVLPSFTEGLPNILLEAMACGTPVLATPVGAVPDVVSEGKTGFLLKSTRPEHIAERVVELLSNPDSLERVSSEACNSVRKKFCFEKTLESWRNILKELDIHTKGWSL